jgi:hypothetical protein
MPDPVHAEEAPFRRGVRTEVRDRKYFSLTGGYGKTFLQVFKKGLTKSQWKTKRYV